MTPSESVPASNTAQEPEDLVLDIDRKTRRNIIAASFIGNFVEWFDYASYGYLATMIAAAFFPKSNPTLGLLATFAVFAISFIIRPFGGIFWGRLGDRVGRRAALSWSILIMSAATFVIALLPTYHEVGYVAPILLLIVRLVQGFSAAGEYGGAAAFLSEYAPPNRRGVYTSVVPASTATGLLVGSLLAALLTSVLPSAGMDSFGWRLPFLLALPLGFIGWYIRTRVEDTPVFQRLEKASEVPHAPMRELFANHRKELVIAFGVTLLNAVGFYMILSYMPIYLSEEVGLGQTESFLSTTVALLTYIFFIFASGMISDRVGRRTMLIAASIVFIVLAVPLFFLLGHSSFLGIVLIEIVLGAMLTMNDGTLATYLTELFPTRVRFTGFAFSFNWANALFGGTAPFVATLLIAVTGNKLSPAWYLAGAALVTLFAILAGKETAREPLRHE